MPVRKKHLRYSKGRVHTHSCNYRVDTIHSVSVSERCCHYYYPVASVLQTQQGSETKLHSTMNVNYLTRLPNANAKYKLIKLMDGS